MDRVEKLEAGEERKAIDKEGNLVSVPFDILDKDLQPALSTALRAEAAIETRENRKEAKQIGLFILMLGGADGLNALAPLELSDGLTIDGDYEDVDDADAE